MVDVVDIPMVKSPENAKWRPGRGYSKGELEKAGLTVRAARRAGYPVDVRRKSVHPENVKILQDIRSGGSGPGTSTAA
ncbi:MAG: ribosomal protein L13e [Candidatus Thorarchaeota archaeon]